MVYNDKRLFTSWNVFHILNNLLIDIDPNSNYRIMPIFGNFTFTGLYQWLLDLNSLNYLANNTNRVCHKGFKFVNEEMSTYELRDYKKKSWQKWSDKLKSQAVKKMGLDVINKGHGSALIYRNSRVRNFLCNISGIHLIMPENFEVETRKIMRLSVLAGVHGNGLTNMVFLPNRSTVVEIMPKSLASEFILSFYHNMAKMLGHNYHMMVVNDDVNNNVLCDKLLNTTIKVILNI